MKRLMQLCVLVLLLGSAQAVIAAPSLIDHYRKALVADPQNQTLRYHLGVALLNHGRNREAFEAFRAVYSSRAGDPEINFNLALVCLRLKDPDSVLLYLDQAAVDGARAEPEIYPLHNVYFNLALLYEELGRLEDARALLQRLVAERPERVEYLRQLGDYQLRLGEVDAAVRTIERYLQQMPGDSEMRAYAYAALYNRALAAYEGKDLAAARAEFARARRFSDDDSLIAYYLALFDYQQRKYAEVAAALPGIYGRLNEEQRANARSVLFNTALALKQEGDLVRARQVLQPLGTGASPRVKDLSLLAGIALQTGAFEEARSIYLRVQQLEPGHGAAVDGVLAAEKGAFNQLLDQAGQGFAVNDLPTVRDVLARAAAIYPQDNRLRINQVRLEKASRAGWLALQQEAEELEKQQQYVEALRVLRRGLALAPAEKGLLQQEKKLVRLLDTRIETLFRQAEAEYAAGELLSAQQHFAEVLELSPAHQRAREWWQRIGREALQRAERAIGAGEAALERGDPLAARKAFTEALAFSPDEAAAGNGLRRSEQMLTARVAETLVRVRRMRSEGDLAAAGSQLRDALGRWEDASLRGELAQVEEELGRRRASLVQLVREAMRQQQFRRAETLLGQMGNLGTAAEGEVLQAELLAARRSAVESQLDLARQEIAAGRYDVGLKAYRRALDIEPDNVEALAGTRRGKESLTKVLAGYLTEGGAAHRAGKLEQARLAYRQVLALDPHRAEALDALRQIERAGRAGLTGADVERLYLQGIALYTEGDYRQAIAVWQQVLDLESGHEKARMNIDKAQRKLRQIQERQNG